MLVYRLVMSSVYPGDEYEVGYYLSKEKALEVLSDYFPAYHDQPDDHGRYMARGGGYYLEVQTKEVEA